MIANEGGLNTFEADYEIRVLSAALHDDTFFASRGVQVDPVYFSVPALRKLWYVWQHFFKEYNELPSVNTTIDLIGVWQEKDETFWGPQDLDFLLDALSHIYKEYENQSYTIDRFFDWVKKQALQQKVSEIIDGVSEGKLVDPSQAVELLKTDDIDRLFNADVEEDDFSELLISHIIEKKTRPDGGLLPLGIPPLDLALGGGSQRGYKNIIMGPPGGGKTTTATILSSSLVTAGLNVYYFFNDDTKAEIMDRHTAAFSSIPIDELIDDHNFNELKELARDLKQSRGKLFIQYVHPTTTPFQLEQVIRKKIREGHKIDRVIVDHIRNLQPDAAFGRSKNQDSWDVIGKVFIGLMSIPLQFNCDLWAVAHTKREAETKTWMDQNMIGLSYEPVKDANIILAAWRLDGDLYKHTGRDDAIRYQIVKRRGGPGMGERQRYTIDFLRNRVNQTSWDEGE